MTSRARSKYLVSVSLTSSASRSSAKGVKPTRSANRMLTNRRSAPLSVAGVAAVVALGCAAGVGVGRVRAVGVVAVAPPASGVAHSEQNFADGGLTMPQFGQPAARGEAHSMQNLAPA